MPDDSSTGRPPGVKGGVQQTGPHSLTLDFAGNPEAAGPYREWLESGQAWQDFCTWADGAASGGRSTPDRLAAIIHDALCSRAPSCAKYREGTAHHDFYQLRAESLLDALGPEIGTANVIRAVKAVLEECV